MERYLETIKLQSVVIREDVEVIKAQTLEIKQDGVAAEQQRQVILQNTQAIHCRTEVIEDATVATKIFTMVSYRLYSVSLEFQLKPLQAEAAAGQERGTPFGL